MSKKKETEQLAKESQKTKRAREKLQRKFLEVDKKITSSALEKKTLEIHQWIARHASQRVILKTKSISLFDENQNAAINSSIIHILAKKIQNELEKFQAALKENNFNVSLQANVKKKQ
jgi:uncharacterized protein (DUF2132 family)